MNTNDALKASIELERLRKENREMKALVKLVDFTPEQLSFALELFGQAQAEAQHIVDRHIEMGISDGAPAHQKRVDTAQLWATQLITAKAKVIANEIVNQN